MSLLTKFTSSYCNAEVRGDVSHLNDIHVYGKITEPVDSDEVRYIAANPPDYRATFTGSGLPFANQDQAFDNTPNTGYVKLVDGTFEIHLMYPNSYYIGLGTVMIPPTVYLLYKNRDGVDRRVSIVLSEGIPYRTLTYPSQRGNVGFYEGGWRLPVRTQEEVLRDSRYPSTNYTSPNFWGLKPRM